MNKSYIEQKKARDAVEAEKNYIVFGLMGGIILMLVGVLRWLAADGFREVLYLCVCALGLVLFLLGIAVPGLLKYPYKAFRFFGNTVGRAVFATLLTVLYVLLILPVGLLLRRKREAQGYFTWTQEPPEPRSMFADLAQSKSPAQKSGKASYFEIVYRLLAGLIANGKMILIPIVIILVIAGLILFFVSSNVMTAFIYTIF